MDKNLAESRILELTGLLNEYNRLYYVENMPVVSDYDFDMLLKELTELETSYPEFVRPDSPTRNVGSDLKSSDKKKEFAQYPHRYPMLSLGNTYDISEIEDFISRVDRSGIDVPEYSCELKFDGTAICLTYRNGLLVRALTRGDGTIGDEVSANVSKIPSIPQKLSGTGYPDDFEIRGEIYMPYKAFDRLNQERLDEEEQPFANPRNAASGSLKLLEPNIVAKRGLECTLYHILGENLPFSTHGEALEAAASWGLPISDKRKICKNISEIEDYIKYWDTERKTLPFATDGIVIKANSLPAQKQLGYTSKFPRWAVAYKFKAEQALTKVLSIDYQVGRTGAVTPVANLEPVQLSGTVVRRATLHNSDQMQQLDIRINDSVYVEKGGEIIPKITAVELTLRGLDAISPVFPDKCPDCGTTLVRDSGEAKWFCPNTGGCPQQIMGRLLHFIGRKAMNVIAGEATIEQMFRLGMVKTPADFYRLTKDDLLQLEGWKERSAERFLKSVEESKKNGFDKVLFALGIRYVGETTAKTLATYFKTMEALQHASLEELMMVEDVGDVIANSVYNFMRASQNIDEIKNLADAGLNMAMNVTESTLSETLAGKTIVISGNFSVSRNDIKKIIEAHGGKNSSSISSKTSFLLAGSKPGPEKIKKADNLGIAIISEDQFRDMLEARSPESSSDNSENPEEQSVRSENLLEEKSGNESENMLEDQPENRSVNQYGKESKSDSEKTHDAEIGKDRCEKADNSDEGKQLTLF